MTSVLMIGYGRQIFDEGNSERARLAACALAVDALHMIVFSQKKHALKPAQAGALFLYPTHSRWRARMLFDAYRIGSSILGSSPVAKGSWIISAQDPFEAGVVGYLLHLRYGLPLQVQEHGDFFGTAWWRRERWGNQLRYLFGRWLLLRADCVRAVSKRVTKNVIAIGVAPKKITTLAVSSDLTAFARGDRIRDAHNLRRRYPDAAAIVLAAGRLVKEKNFSLLIRAFKKVVHTHPTIQLVIVGSGPEEKELVKLVETNNLSARVLFIPWTDDVVSYMRSADIFALSSYREGWARVILEAMVTGLPAVVTDVGCVGEVFKDGRHGIVVAVNDMEAVTRALEKLISDPHRRHKLGENAARDIVAFTASQLPYAEAWRKTIEACGKSKGGYNE